MQGIAGGVIRPHDSKLALLYRISDATIIVFTLVLALKIRGIPVTSEYLSLALVAVISFSFFGRGFSIYRSERGSSTSQLIWPIVMSWMITIFILLLAAYFFKASSEYSRIVIGIWFAMIPTALIFWRVAIRMGLSHYRIKGHNSRSVAIVGAGDAGYRLGKVIKETPSFGLNLIGYFDNRQGDDGRVSKNLVSPLMGNIDDLVRRAQNNEFDLIYIALAFKGEELISKLIESLADTKAAVHLVPDFFVFDLLHSRWINLSGVQTISVYESPFLGVDGWLKRLEDVVLSVLILALIAVPMLFIAVAVKINSSGPVLFKQRRYGVGGKAISVWKFRSMFVCDDGDRIIQAKRGDRRITSLGNFLRRTSLDELPQFINVLMGEMSIVGPRPHAVAHNEEYRKLISGYMLRHKVKPGITGWAQVNGWRGETDTLDKMEQRVEYDLHYIRNWSLWWDIKIVFRTVLTGFTGKSVY